MQTLLMTALKIIHANNALYKMMTCFEFF